MSSEKKFTPVPRGTQITSLKREMLSPSQKLVQKSRREDTKRLTLSHLNTNSTAHTNTDGQTYPLPTLCGPTQSIHTTPEKRSAGRWGNWVPREARQGEAGRTGGGPEQEGGARS